MSFTVIIPARFASSRLPGKPLADIAGKPMIQHVFEKAQQSGASRVIIATDNEQVEKAAKAFGAEVCMTSEAHNSGTERLAEVVTKLGIADDEIIVNIQGDEPLIPPVIVSQVAENLAKFNVNMATLAVKIHEAEELFNPNAVKVVTDKDGYVLYFSRSVIPYDRDQFMQLEDISKAQLADVYLRHIGIYAYRAGFIKQYVQWAPMQLENLEKLEQLRVLWYGERIHVELAKEVPAVGVDTAEDLEKVRSILAKNLPCEFTVVGSSSLKSGLVAEGIVDCYVRLGKTGEWDTAGAEILLAEINGMIFDPHYQPLTYNHRESLINPPFVMVADNTQNWASVFQFN